MAVWEKLLQQHGNRAAVWSPRLFRGAAAGAALAVLSVSLPSGADAAQRNAARIDAFGPYKIGMPLAQARDANKRAKQGACGDVAADRQCLMLDAAVFEEPAVIYAVLDAAGARIERIVAQMDPQLTRRRAYRCVRLSEKVFSLLVVVYGPKYKQSHDENRRPLPAVAWDGAESGRLVFETRCRTPDEGNPRISVIEYYPDGVKPPPVAATPRPAPKVAAAPPAPATLDATAPVADVPLSVQGQGMAPPPHAAPVGVVEEIQPGTPDTSGALEAAAMATLTRELAQAKGKVPPSMEPAVQSAEAPRPPAAPAAPVAEAAPVPAPPAGVPPTAPAVQTGGDQAASAPAGANTAPAGRYDVPVDIAPSATAAVTSAANIGEPRSEGAATPSAAVDPGPVTLPVSPAPPATTPAPAPVPAVAPVAVAPAAVAREPVVKEPKETAAPSQTPAAQDEKPRSSRDEAVAYATPGPRQEPAPVGKARPWPGRSLRTAIVPPSVRPPYYGDPGAYPEPTDLEAPEPFTVPEEEGLDDRAEAADSAPAAPALAMTDETNAARTIEAEVQRRLAAAPVPYDTAPAGPRREQPVPPRPVPTSLLSEASTAGHKPEARGPGSTPQPEQEAPQPSAPSVLAAAPSTAPVATPAPAEKEEPGGTAAKVAAGAANVGRIAPVMTGGWRHPAPVPPPRPWRDREDPREPSVSGG